MTVNSLNDVPSIDPLADRTIPEDALEQTVALTGISGGGGESQPISITASSSNVSLIPDPLVTYTSPDQVGALRFTPVADQSGTATITVTLEDGGDDGDLNTTFDNATFVETFVVTVDPVNDAPTLDVIPDQTALEDSGPQSVAFSGVTAGGGETNPMRVTASSGNPALVSDLVVTYATPDSTGTLSYTPQLDQVGTTTITVTVEDGGLDGDLNTAADNATFSRTFQVTIDDVNDAPTLDDPSDVTVDEDSPEQTVALTGITAGPGESQSLRVTASSDTPGLIPDPIVTYTSPSTGGSIAFTPVVDAFGVATITVTVEDSGLDGDFNTTADNLSVSQTFTVTVNNLPDPPTPMDDQLTSNEDAALRIDSSALLANDIDPDLGTGSAEVLTIVMPPQSTSQLGATVTYDSTTGQIIYDPSTSTQLQALAPGENLEDSFTYSVTDADGEVTPPTATVFLDIAGLNDAPTVVDDVVPAPITLDPVVIRPLDNDFDVDGTLDLDSIIITQDPVFGSIAKRINSQGILELAYSPFVSFTGSDMFRYTISDDLGQASGQATVTIQPSNAPRTGSDVGGGVARDVINIDVLANDVPVRGQLDLASLTIVSDPANGQAVPQADGTVTYIPDDGFFGVDSFQYTITDTEGNVSDPTIVTVRAVESGLENPLLYGDVNASGDVTSLDALLIINRLSRSGGQSGIPVGIDERGPNFYDVNGNSVITSLDALLVINRIGQNAATVSAELVGPPIIADLASSRGEFESIEGEFDAAGFVPIESQELGVVPTAEVVDSRVIALLAEAQDSHDADESDDEMSALNDLAILDLIARS